MSEALHIQIALKAAPQAIMKAWVEALPAWFAEQADVSTSEKRYDFWGRFTPDAPDRESGRHPLLAFIPAQQVRFGWQMSGKETAVDVRVHQLDGGHVLVIRHEGVTKSHDIDSYTQEDFWFLSLENLRRHLDGKRPVRCDFSKPMIGDIQHTIEIDTPREAVFEALIKPEQLQRWIATSGVIVEPHVGGQYNLGWGQDAGALKILDLTPNEILRLSWPEGSGETVVTWTLEGSGGKTRLTLGHSGFVPDQPTGGLNAGWLNFMSWVKSLTEYGADWKPATIRLAPGMEAFYPASIADAQSKLVTS
jgi:uncharacterized protein YndB with AHSA1/START domain